MSKKNNNYFGKSPQVNDGDIQSGANPSYQKKMFGKNDGDADDNGPNPPPTGKTVAAPQSGPQLSSGMERAMHEHADKVHPRNDKFGK